jgi:hypothetical protein
MQHPKRIRWGMFSLFAAGLCITAGMLLRGAFLDPRADANAFAQSVTAGGFAPGNLLFVLASLLEIFGSIALYAVFANGLMDRIAFWAMIFTIAGIVFLVPFFGMSAFAMPTLGQLFIQGQSNVMQIADAAFNGLATYATLAITAVATMLGSLLFGFALWRTRLAPAWVAALFALHNPFLVVGPLIAFALELLGGICLLISGAWLAWKWRTR